MDFLPGRVELSNEAVAIPDRGQKLGVERIAIHRPFVQHHVVGDQIAGLGIHADADTRILRGVVVEIFELVRRRQSDGMEFEKRQWTAVEYFERCRDTADGTHHGSKRIRPKALVESRRIDGLYRSKKLLGPSHRRLALLAPWHGRVCRIVRS